MLTAQPSPYDKIALIEIYGRKVQSVKAFFFERTNCQLNLAWFDFIHHLEESCTPLNGFKPWPIGQLVSLINTHSTICKNNYTSKYKYGL